MTLRLTILIAALAGVLLASQEKATPIDELSLQIVILKSQLAQALSAGAKCEADGPQSAKVAQEANTAAQTLIKDLDARGLMIDQKTSTIIAKPTVAPKDGKD